MNKVNIVRIMCPRNPRGYCWELFVSCYVSHGKLDLGEEVDKERVYSHAHLNARLGLRNQSPGRDWTPSQPEVALGHRHWDLLNPTGSSSVEEAESGDDSSISSNEVTEQLAGGRAPGSL